MAVTVTNKKGKKVTLLNPSEKGKKFAFELKSGTPQTNNGLLKTDKNGKIRSLTKEQRAYRSGYLDAQKDSAKAYKHHQAKGKR